MNLQRFIEEVNIYLSNDDDDDGHESDVRPAQPKLEKAPEKRTGWKSKCSSACGSNRSRRRSSGSCASRAHLEAEAESAALAARVAALKEKHTLEEAEKEEGEA